MTQTLLGTPLFGLGLTLLAGVLGLYIKAKSGWKLFNPMLFGMLLIISVLLFFNIPYADYQAGGDLILAGGEEITESVAERIEDSGLEEILIRSVLTCESRRGVCMKCYGRNLATGRIVEIPVGVADCVHQHKSDRRLRPVCPDGCAQPSGGIGHQSARVAVHAFQGWIVAQARGHGIAASDVLRHLGVAQIEDAGLDHGQIFVILEGRRQFLVRSHDHLDLLPTLQELLNQQPSCCSSRPNYKGRHLEVSHFLGGWRSSVLSFDALDHKPEGKGDFNDRDYADCRPELVVSRQQNAPKALQQIAQRGND